MTNRQINLAPKVEELKESAKKKRRSSQKVIRWNRKAHRWVAMAIALPMVFVIATGLFLQVRKPVDWIQPPTAKGSQKYEPTVVLEQVLTEVKAIPEMQVNGWSDIKLLDMRPKKGIIKVRNFDELETQVDATTGEVLQTAQRQNDFVVKMHDFSAWGARLWLGLPIRLGFLAIFLMGVYLNIKTTPARLRELPFWPKRSAAKNSASKQTSSVMTSLKDTEIAHVDSASSAPNDTLSAAVSAPTSVKAKGSAKDIKDGRPKRLRLKSWLLKYHYWLGWVVIVPWAFVISSGLLLQVRYEVPWVMPVQQEGSGTVPTVEYVQVLASMKVWYCTNNTEHEITRLYYTE